MDEINLTSWQNHHVSKSTRLLQFCSTSGKYVRTSRNQWTVERSNSRLPASQHVDFFWNRWRTNPVWMGYFDRTHNITISMKDSRKIGHSSTKSSKNPRQDHLYVHTQRHRFDKKSKFQGTFLDSRLTQTANIHSWELPVRWIGDACEREVHDARFIWVLLFRKQSCSQSFLQIISVSTGAIVDWCDELVQQILGHSFSSVEKSGAKLNEQFYRKLVSEKVITLVRTRETKIQRARDPLCIHQERFDFQWEKDISNLWIGWIHEISIYWTTLSNQARYGWCLTEKNMITQRVYVTSWSPSGQVRVKWCLDQYGIET